MRVLRGGLRGYIFVSGGEDIGMRHYTLRMFGSKPLCNLVPPEVGSET